MYCDREAQHDGGITGAAKTRKRRKVLVKDFEDREGVQLESSTIPHGTNTSLDVPGEERKPMSN